MLEIVDFIYNNRFRTFWDQRIAWKTFMRDIQGLSPIEKEVVLECILQRHAKNSEELEATYPNIRMWYKVGSWHQAKLDKQLFHMMILIHHHSDV